jgi:hypothetical protein
MADLSDDQLLKRARHGARNLTVLAVMASVLGLGLFAAQLTSKGAPGLLWLNGAAISILAVAYWFLMVAAHRGDPKAVGIVVVAAGVQITANLIFSGVAAARTGSEFKLNPGGFVLPILVMLALASSRKVLLELGNRGLWERVFGPAKPTAQLCRVGIILIVFGLVTLNATSFGVGVKVAQARGVEKRWLDSFKQMISKEEQQFRVSLENAAPDYSPEKLREASAKLKLLEERVAQLKTMPSSERLSPVLVAYSGAVAQYKDALRLLTGPRPDGELATKRFEVGDQMRNTAGEQLRRIGGTAAPKPNG